MSIEKFTLFVYFLRFLNLQNNLTYRLNSSVVSASNLWDTQRCIVTDAFFEILNLFHTKTCF